MVNNTALSQAAWQALSQVMDPEMPYISIVDLGVVRHIKATQDELEVTLTPTFSACPAMALMEEESLAVLAQLSKKVTLKQQLSPAWSTDWITPKGHESLRQAGILPPAKLSECGDSQAVHFHPRVRCTLCASSNTELLSAFSATSCKALYRCRTCREPFEVMKSL